MKLAVEIQVIFLLVAAISAAPYEIAYDDGEPENRYTWEGYSIGSDLLGAFAMRMTADSYPVGLYAVKFGFTRMDISSEFSSWNFCILGHDESSGNPDEANVLYISENINVTGMEIPVWPSFGWYEYGDEDAFVEVEDDWWVVCHGHWFGDAANWYICADETDGGLGRDKTKTVGGWIVTSDVLTWNGGDLLIRSVVDEPGIRVNAASFGRIKALFE